MDNPTITFSTKLQTLTEKHLNNFWGYGNLNSDIWFVGMEEGLGTIDFLEERFKASGTDTPVCDIVDDMVASEDHMKWFQENPPLQKTYKILIFILLYLKHQRVPTLDELRVYQHKHFARTHSNHASLELMPLPSRSIHEQDWLYGNSGIEGLASRKEYLATHKPRRVQELDTLIKEYNPRLVIFYSRTYLDDWQTIAGGNFEEIISEHLEVTKNHNTVYAVIPHPVYQGMSNQDWEYISNNLYNLMQN